MKRKCMKLILTLFLLSLFVGGCHSTGFDKRTTLIPDRIGLSFSQQRFKTEDAAWKGVTFSMQWDLK